MRLVGTKALRPGDVLDAPILTSSGRVILSAETVLTENYIKKIKQMGVHKVYINDSRFDDVELTSNSVDDRIKNEATQVLEDAYKNLHTEKTADEYILKDISKSLVDYVRETKEKGVSILSLKAADDYIIEHSINVSILTAFLGNQMNFNYNQLCDLVTGALIHDLGRENEKEENHEHVQKGFDVMRKCRGLSLHSAIVCFEHHENFDGSGYPRKLKGEAISDFSRIIRVADLYDNLLHGYGSQDIPMMPHQAYENILAVSGSIVDPRIVETFRDTIIFYPNGCTVLLSNGLCGVIVRQNQGSPQRPVVRTFDDSGIIGEIDLLKNLTLSVKDVVTE